MNQIETKMGDMRLHGMSRTWEALKETRRLHELNLQEGMEILLQAEEEERTNRRFKRLSANAGFRYKASIEELRLDPSRGMDKNLITTLATGEYIDKGNSVLVSGSTGSGKSFLASALGHQACLQGYTQKLMVKAKLVRLEGSSIRFFDKLAKADLLILDDFGLTHLDKQQELDFMEMIEDRHGKCSTIIVSQLPVGSWYDVFTEDTIADAVLDRLIHGSYRIEIKGESLRKKQ